MEKIFYTNRSKYPATDEALKYVFSQFFDVENPVIVRNENGKKYLSENKERIFFSVSHTAENLFIAVSDENVGLDAEKTDRKPVFEPIVKKFPPDEREEIRSSQDFLRHWTAKEAAVKWLGGALAHDLYKLSYINGIVRYGEATLPIVSFREIAGHILAVCGERDFSQAETLPF